ncbi:MAG: hypothetical protein GY841_11900 [FCB group bacterium]|nr:hypothetical protein [FCB group bacterium]
MAGGIAFNEMIADPNSSTYNYDTDGSGAAESEDELVEIINLGSTSIDITGFQLWDAGLGNWYTFPATTVLQPGCPAVVVISVQSGGSFPTVTGNNLAFDAAEGSGVFTNGGDNLVLYDPNNDQFIQMYYNGDAVDNPVSDYSGFSGSASIVGAVENWGSDTDGLSIGRNPDGGDTIAKHNTFSADNASPGALNTPFELLLTEIAVTPTTSEFIEIHNPTGATLDLSDVYLTDATNSGSGVYYYKIVTGSDYGGGGSSDFHARFPDGATIDSGEYQTVALTGSADFLAGYGAAPTYELFDDSSADGEDGIMREAAAGSINDQGGLSNGGEIVILYSWDGASDLVSDLDYVVWGDKAEAVDKSSISVDGPDEGSDTSTYENDTATGSQDVVASGSHDFGNSWQRDDLDEGTETKSGGNGLDGHDETSENLGTTFVEDTATPNEEYVPDNEPTVSSTSPADSDTGVDPITNSTVNFSEDATVSDAWYTINGTIGGSYTAAVTGGDQNYTLNPDTDFKDTETVTVTIVAANVTDQDGDVDNMASNSQWTFDVSAPTITLIHDIQGSGTTSAEDGNAHIIEGIVVGDFQGSPTGLNGFYVQEENADADGNPATSEGIFVSDGSFGTDVVVQDKVRVAGTVDEYSSNGSSLTELTSVTAVTVLSSGNALPTAASISFPLSSVDALEAFEGMQVTIPETLYVTETCYLGRYVELTLSANFSQPAM